MSDCASSVHAALHEVIVREFAWKRHACKLLAALTGASPRTCEKWLAGTHMPHGDALVRLMAKNEAVDAEMERMKQLIRASSS